MRAVELADAIIAANASRDGLPAEVKVLRRSDNQTRRFDFTWGACESRWHIAPDHRMGFLHEIMWFLALTLRIDPATIHEAILAVAEYRDLEGQGSDRGSFAIR